MTENNPNPDAQDTDTPDAGANPSALGDAAQAADGDAQGDKAQPENQDKDVKADADKAADGADGKDSDKSGDQGDQGETILGAPESYDFKDVKLAEGQELDTELADQFTPVMKDLNLNQAAADKLVQAFADKAVPILSQRITEQVDNAGAQLRADLARDLQADKEVGGTKLEESRAMAAKAIAHFVPEASDRNEFSKFMNESGLGNHPLLMRIVAGAGRQLAEATSTPGDGNQATEKTAAQVFFPSQQGGN